MAISSGHDERFLEFSAARVFGLLEGEEPREFEAHLKAGCPLCRDEIGRAEEAALLLPMGVRRAEPAPDLKERILFSVQLAKVARAALQPRRETAEEGGAPASSSPPPSSSLPEGPPPHAAPAKKAAAPQAGALSPRARRSWLSTGLSFALLVMIVGFVGYIVSLLGTLREQDDYIVNQRIRIVELRDSLQRRDEIMKVLEARRVAVVTLDGLKADPAGYGKLFWDPAGRVAILHVSNLPPTPQGKDYQLWVIRDKRPLSAGVFALTSGQNFFQVRPIDLPDASGVDAFAVTLEPKGGAAQPGGELFLLGKFPAP